MEARKPRIGLLVCLIFIHSAVALGNENLIPGSRYTSAEGAAMADAYIPIADDGPSALFYNPAAIGKIARPSFEVINVSAYGNGGYPIAVSKSAAPWSTFSQVLSLPAFLPTLESNPGLWVGGGYQAVATASLRGIAFGVLMNNEFGASYDSSTGKVTYRSLYQLIPTAGFGIRLAGGIVRIGYSLQWIQQASGTQTVDATTTPDYNTGISQGWAFSHTVGFAMTLPVAYLPSLNFVARNILGTTYNSGGILLIGAKNGSGVPPTEPMSFDGALGAETVLGQGVHAHLAIEYRDITNTSGTDILEHAAGGLEIGIKNSFYLRGGWGGGYPAAGIGFKGKSSEFNITWQSVELGTSYQAQRDVHYLLQFQMRIP